MLKLFYYRAFHVILVITLKVICRKNREFLGPKSYEYYFQTLCLSFIPKIYSNILSKTTSKVPQRSSSKNINSPILHLSHGGPKKKWKSRKKLKKLTPSALWTKENLKLFNYCAFHSFFHKITRNFQESIKSIQKIRNAFYCNESFLFYCYYEHPYRLFNSASRQEWEWKITCRV